MTKLKQIPFFILLGSLALDVIISIVGLVYNLVFGVDSVMVIMEEAFSETGMNMPEGMRSIAVGLFVVGFLISLAFAAMWAVFAVNQKKKLSRGTYLIVWLVFVSLGLIFNIWSVVANARVIGIESGAVFSLVVAILGILANGAMITGFVLHKRDPEIENLMDGMDMNTFSSGNEYPNPFSGNEPPNPFG
ncbi:MAG: hypothetical protein FWC82_00505 [Firmicutes bacterium]|nr:hypothetical protein [Bacillota bacterium]